ncbi:MAG: preprotein translocase subunit SecG [Actinobacteria bacterium]|nr:preprotein translocase subunit SecG [Actinomycetota bacterium]
MTQTLYSTLMILFFIIAVLLILVILMQRGRGGGLVGAFGGPGGSSAFGAKTGDVFTVITVVMAALFLIIGCLLAFRPTPQPFVEPPTAAPIQSPASPADESAQPTDSDVQPVPPQAGEPVSPDDGR